MNFINHLRLTAKKGGRFEITKLFMAKADWDRRFLGLLRDVMMKMDILVVYGKITVLNGFVSTQAACQDELGEKLDEMVLMVLDYYIHKISGHDFIVSSN